jgi:ATPase subunit of ABC transporter with duplicated ATPase domains
VLGIARARRALAAIERGQATEDRFAAVGDDWDVEERARATLDRLGLGHLDLDRRVGEVSGGEAVLLGLAAQLLRRPDVLLLDLVDQVADLRDGTLTWHGGNLTAYEAAVAVEQEAAQRLVRTAASDVQRQQRELRDARIKLDRRHRYGQKMWGTKREPKIIMGARKRQAEVAAGKHRGMQIEKLEQARERLAEATDAVHDDDEIRVDLPGTAVPSGRTVLTVHHARLRGGAGKTTLLETVVGTLSPLAGSVTAAVPLRSLPQAPGRARRRGQHRRQRGPVRAGRLRQRRPGPPGQVPVPRRPGRPAGGHLSGGERFRATLLLAEPAPQLLLLDEPTNNLDMASTSQLAQALAAYRGALVVASHDLPFLRTIGITRWLRLEGRLIRIDPP